MTTYELSSKAKKTNIKTVNTKLADVNYSSNLELLKKFSNYIDQIKNIEDQVKISLAYYNSIQTGDPIKDISEFFIDLNNNKFKDIDNEFIEFWSKRYDIQIEPIKKLVEEKINSKNNFLNFKSDSIGLLCNTDNKIDDSVTPVFDLYCDIYGTPNYIPIQLKNKISKITEELTKDLSKKNNSLFRVNLRNIYFSSPTTSPYVDSSTAHGLNLITDYNFYLSYSKVFRNILIQLLNLYSNVFSYIQYFSNIANFPGVNLRNYDTNIQKISNFYFNIDNEGIKQNVDFLLNKIKSVTSSKTIKNSLSNLITENKNPSVNSLQSANQVSSVQNLSMPVPFDKTNDFAAEYSKKLDSFNINPEKYFNEFLSPLNTQQFTPSFNFPSVLNFGGAASSLTNSITNAFPIPSIPNFSVSSGTDIISQLMGESTFGNSIPFLNSTIGAFGNLNVFNGGFITDPMNVYNSVMDIKQTICNFVPPVFDIPNFSFNTNFFDSLFKTSNVLPKFGAGGFSDFTKSLQSIADNFTKNITDTFTKVVDDLTTCG